jgi:predicted transcriptional regulator
MPTSVRLDPALEAKLRAIARAEGIPLSEVMRRAAQRFVDDTGSLLVRMADAIGAVKSGGGRGRRSGEAFKRLIRRQA